MNLTAHLDELSFDDAEGFRQVVSCLKAWPDAAVSEGFAARVMAAVDAEQARDEQPSRFRFPFPFRRVAAAAALIALLVSVGLYFGKGTVASRPASARDDLGWLASVQDPDSGFWLPESHGGSPAYRPALTALAMLALAEEPDPNRFSSQIQQACRALAESQLPSGAFGGEGRAECYNHAITTFALASLSSRCPEVQPILVRAVRFIDRSQSAAGGWDYLQGSDGNTALTAWNLRALARAKELGLAEAHRPFCKGLRWLRRTVRTEGAVAYHENSPVSRSESLQALTASALLDASRDFPELEALGRTIAAKLSASESADEGLDCYRDYAKFLAFSAAGDSSRAKAVGNRLRTHPVQDLHDDAWGCVGGYLYARSLTALAQSR